MLRLLCMLDGRTSRRAGTGADTEVCHALWSSPGYFRGRGGPRARGCGCGCCSGRPAMLILLPWPPLIFAETSRARSACSPNDTTGRDKYVIVPARGRRPMRGSVREEVKEVYGSLLLGATILPSPLAKVGLPCTAECRSCGLQSYAYMATILFIKA